MANLREKASFPRGKRVAARDHPGPFFSKTSFAQDGGTVSIFPLNLRFPSSFTNSKFESLKGVRGKKARGRWAFSYTQEVKVSPAEPFPFKERAKGLSRSSPVAVKAPSSRATSEGPKEKA